ncbi:MAG: 1-deoxy-D-xylulose-5-phosphate reductoisomerase [Acidobacteria bacterium]|nr:1-deoxy-D-xylulose-5-phosphate reductoisomerase [Acidobacteriota bacterium]MBI3654852.1 1-deoxy-D-xylulose-5-phosphate reductoisomerase [Acidobacteriota bacterium]
MKNIVLLGSTGSVGTNTLDVVRAFPDRFKVIGLAAGNNVEKLAEQVVEFAPSIVSVADELKAGELVQALRHVGLRHPPCEIVWGVEGATEIAVQPAAQLVLGAMSGSQGLLPIYRAVEAGKDIALANKETLVIAGQLIMAKAKEKGVQILPVDSEHNAIHQCLRGVARSEIRRLILTASGGPFLHTPKERWNAVKPSEALNHPTWRMGQKITIDSATLMNKGLEVIEAHWLFGVSPSQIDVVIHPQSTVHSLVEMIDGSIIAQMGITDMRSCIQYALTYPERLESKLPGLDFGKPHRLEFFSPDREKFACLDLAYKALQVGGTMPTVLNAANEVAVAAFLSGRLAFSGIPETIALTMEQIASEPVTSVERLTNVDARARIFAEEAIAMHV